jgi:hypothetical protein
MKSIIAPSGQAHWKAYRKIRAEVSKRHEEESKRAGLLGRLKLWFRIERETAKELEKRFPTRVLRAVTARHV